MRCYPEGIENYQDKRTVIKDLNKVDLRLDEGLREQIEQIAVSVFGARNHHISGRPEITTTLNRLIKLGIEAINQDTAAVSAGNIQDRLKDFDERILDLERETYRAIEYPAYPNEFLESRIESLEKEVERLKKPLSAA